MSLQKMLSRTGVPILAVAAVLAALPYAPYPPMVTYVSPPPVVFQQAVPAAPAQSAMQVPAPSHVASTAQTLSIEDRLRRLRSLCEQGLFTEAECNNCREQILQEL